MCRLKKKEVQYVHHLQAYTEHLAQNTSPKYLTLRTAPALGNQAPHLAEHWTMTNTDATCNISRAMRTITDFSVSIHPEVFLALMDLMLKLN